ncbi:MAG: hypothetical protein K0R71_813 [Bacillales bacterium]|jgi:hypothetical protein|nr:hypothetical protein [Bacillales bacterium]
MFDTLRHFCLDLLRKKQEKVFEFNQSDFIAILAEVEVISSILRPTRTTRAVKSQRLNPMGSTPITLGSGAHPQESSAGIHPRNLLKCFKKTSLLVFFKYIHVLGLSL